jgi:hypothetical protein
MKELIDVTHTVKASAAPSEGARYMLDPATNERFWVEQGTVPAGVPEPEQTTYRGILAAPMQPTPEVPPRGTMVKMPVRPNPEIPPAHMPTKGRKK